MPAPAPTREFFGRAGGTDVHRYTLGRPGGLTVRVLDYGGVIQSLDAPDRDGRPGNVVLGFPDLAGYVANNRPGADRVFLGALIGRFANRIAGGTFTLDGVQYRVPLNNGKNSLHGGPAGFDTRVWSATEVRDDDGVALRLTLVSPDGDQGYPGRLETEVTYRVDAGDRLRITYRATTDAPTVVNLTNHTYWNLAGEGSGDVHEQWLQLAASRYCPTGEDLIPAGAPAPVEGTPFDFRRPVPIGARLGEPDPQLAIGHGYDHNWVLDGGAPFAARAWDPASGRLLTVRTTEPGLQFYSGNYLTAGLTGTSGRPYHRGAGFALEAQHFPDAPNRPDFPGTVLRPGEVYHQETVFALTTADEPPPA
ncbi:aldose epimerase family protein [Amycolatopsis vancoresmycina]|uniref:Aldose 1-epimerase n=1 Tax=Amycolatopsis vancoresmycina DSM 44592 TaxID=1292037 RepID=R1IFF4_9PSEU|nr:aldose epimerase family protein [Amycolatopsis vancoresmycina]EOD69134.1 aldose 1-epimerase [Amycolatopsis vancoresmycina DSM 44592]